MRFRREPRPDPDGGGSGECFKANSSLSIGNTNRRCIETDRILVAEFDLGVVDVNQASRRHGG
jgi:hypothetical protein